MPNRGDDDTTRIGERTSVTPPGGVARNRPRLVVVAGGSVGAMYRVTDGAVVGRGSDVAIRIDSEELSRRHARFVVRDGVFELEDLGSRNGTYINGGAVTKPRAIADGDKVEIGGIVLRFALFDHLDEQYQEQIYETSLRDGLTRAFNRKYFDERLDGEFAFALRHNAPLSLLMFDVDHFKSVNDSWGHPAGDTVLVELTAHVLNVIRTEDVLARYGGEEFAVLSRGIRLVEAVAFGERLRSAIERHHFTVGTQRVPVTVSIGIAALPSVTIGQPDALVRAADEALYRAKAAGRNRVEQTE